MRTYGAIAVFAALVFGVGWTSHVLAGRMGSGKESHSCETRSCPRRFGTSGPSLEDIDLLTRELSLAPDQVQALRQLVEDTSASVKALEKQIHCALFRSRDQVRAILEPEQVARLDAMREEKWEAFRAQRVADAVEWCHAHASLGEAEIASLRQVLEEFENRRGEYFRSNYERPEGPDLDACESFLDELRADCEARLEQFLPAEVVAEMFTYLLRRSCGDRDRDGDDRRPEEDAPPGVP